ncbi:unnamed protein product [Phytophthora fragariaefolia]|uniref:Unnamed protein product n=1 Tax=Phytophthora fragariaefolia TaxID=1490495 RepID=A0A9W7CP30_9STRA|nr:unnamed protein product [Phytophthora fragariaefolia]
MPNAYAKRLQSCGFVVQLTVFPPVASQQHNSTSHSQSRVDTAWLRQYHKRLVLETHVQHRPKHPHTRDDQDDGDDDNSVADQAPELKKTHLIPRRQLSLSDFMLSTISKSSNINPDKLRKLLHKDHSLLLIEPFTQFIFVHSVYMTHNSVEPYMNDRPAKSLQLDHTRATSSTVSSAKQIPLMSNDPRTSTTIYAVFDFANMSHPRLRRRNSTRYCCGIDISRLMRPSSSAMVRDTPFPPSW